MSANAPDPAAAVDLRRILVPVDDSPLSARAIEFAARLPAAELIVLHVASRGPGDSQAIQSELESLAAAHRTDQRTVEVTIQDGDPTDVILDAARDCDLVVMTTRGRGAAGRLLFGSVADRVSRASTTPTLLVRTTDDTAPIPALARIVVPLDGSALGERALPIASTLARELGLPLRLVRAVGLDEVRVVIRRQREAAHNADPRDETGQTYDEALERAKDEAATYLGKMAESLEAPTVETAVLHGEPVFAILEAIGTADLLAMTSHGRKGFRRWMLGSVAEKLVRESPAPVLLTPTRDAPDAG